MSNTDTDNACPVCLESMNGKNLFTTKCGHQFCFQCIFNNVEYADTCPLCRTDLEIEIPIHIRDNRNNNNNNNRRTMHLLDVNSVIDHLVESVNTTNNYSRFRVWNDLALLFNGVFTRNGLIDRETHEMLQREITNIASRNHVEAINDFITNDIRQYLTSVVDNLEIIPEIDDILNTLDEMPNENNNYNNNINLIENNIIPIINNNDYIRYNNYNENEYIVEVD